jgi:hypothetical protein
METSRIDEELRIEMFSEFARTVEKKYLYFCSRHGLEPSLSGMVCYAVAANIIQERTVGHYMVMELWPRALYENRCAQDAHQSISVETGLSERTVRRMLKKQYRYSAERRKE